MALPCFDEIPIPPDTTLVGVCKLSLTEMVLYQGHALEYWQRETGEDPFQEGRDWNDNEGIFVVVEDPVVVVDDLFDLAASGSIIGIAIITDIEGV